MDPATIGARLTSAVVTPLIKKLFVQEAPGAGLADKPVRVSGLVSFKGEKRTLTEKNLHKIAAQLVERAVQSAGQGERPIPADEDEVLADALARTLHALGDLAMDDVQAVHLGPERLAKDLRQAAGRPDDQLSLAASRLYNLLLHTACLHILHFFTQRSTFVPRTLVEQSGRLTDLITKIDILIERIPSQSAEDAGFEKDYADFVQKKYGTLTIVGIDLSHAEASWPLDAAYLSLEAIAPARDRSATALGGQIAAAEAADIEAANIEATEAAATLSSTEAAATLSSTEAAAPLSSTEVMAALEELAEEVAADAAESPVPADQALSGHSRVLLRGVAGSGKTTLVQWLAVCAARQEPPRGMEQLIGRVPFVLPLRTIARQETLPTPDRFLAAVHNPRHGAQPDGWADRVLSAGRGLLLIDGIDEIPDRDRERTRVWLSDLLLAFPDNLWLVTSRPSAVADNWLETEGFAEFALAPMSHDDLGAFIDRWHDAARATCRTDEDRAALDGYQSALHTAVRTKPDLGLLATNPLMCGLICALHRARRGYLPPGRKALYDAALSMLLARRDTERHIYAPGDVQLDEEPQVQLLQRLAYYLIRNGEAELDRAQAERIIDDALPSVPAAAALGDAPRILSHLLLRSGLLREPTVGTIDFVHRTFQDFLGAKAAVEEEDFGMLVGHATDAQWEDVIRMSVAHARPRERAKILTKLLSQVQKNPESALRIYLLALACLEHAPDLDPQVRDKVTHLAVGLIPPHTPQQARNIATVGPLVLELLPPPAELTEVQAHRCVVTASYIATDAAIPYLSRFTDHPALLVRSQLTTSWGRFDTERYFTEVIARLDPDDLYFVAESQEHLRLLDSMGGVSKLLLRGDFSEDDLRTSHSLGQVTHLRLDRNDVLTDLSALTHLSGLRALVLTRCPRARDLTPLSELSLQSLDFAPLPSGQAGGPLPIGLGMLTTLRQLKIDIASVGHLPYRFFPRRITWLDLHVHGPDQDTTWIAEAFPELRQLGITFRNTGSHTARLDLAPLAALPALEAVTVAAAEITGAESLTDVTVTALDTAPPLTGLPAR
ncbi:NACHT domain-containing protein [Streptomyces sp. NBS 14/10]|uniref:NACHT domain-containing protein n=1 Tax=Streptomyces sp. NBS 14/10 TaxID=1945643 RepID=UPI00211AB19D|nr:NACHT domain-containing protein [Streptomyces sp. NBS 14/10]KAK1180201.1 NACHT domain-containing protein [Streptomyces sp. NBS 14/10]